LVDHGNPLLFDRATRLFFIELIVLKQLGIVKQKGLILCWFLSKRYRNKGDPPREQGRQRYLNRMDRIDWVVWGPVLEKSLQNGKNNLFSPFDQIAFTFWVGYDFYNEEGKRR
jgi:hypothetical protein